MDARMQHACEILKSHYYEDQHSRMWMDEIAGHLDWDDSDPEIMQLSKPANKVNNYVVEAAASKNLHSERKRRKKLNDTLYTLRSVVPKISKMDKQSIIGDAISHVLDLQKKIQQIEGEIKGFCSSNEGGDDTQTPTDLKKPLEKRCTESSDAKKSVDKFKVKHGKASETKIVEICKAGKDGIYQVRIECKKDAGLLVDLTRALESVALEIVNSNMCRFHEVIHCTFYVRSLKNVGADELEDMIRQTMASDCSS